MTSTSDAARDLAGEGAPSGSWVTADTQSRGRGRGGHGWVSLRGNFHASLIIRPVAPIDPPSALAFVAALAVAETLEPYHPVQLKWPNDVLAAAAGRKIAGILVEPDTKSGAVIIGFGINLAGAPDGAVSLAELTGDAPAPNALLDPLAGAFAAWMARLSGLGFTAVRVAWTDRAYGIGARAFVTIGTQRIYGTVRGLASDGALMFQTDDGPLTVHSGSLTFKESNG
ncbi:MAG: biotin--[acetyl-CoA-carboxylase] ligase [Pseudomonadota bacterium]|nr:biotin--[acetyl-CoA-carboxylase] ligase [Pseudomonadota bacterium]